MDTQRCDKTERGAGDDQEKQVFQNLCCAGLVKPQLEHQGAPLEPPADLCDPSKLFQRLDTHLAKHRDVQSTGSEPITAQFQDTQDVRRWWVLFEHCETADSGVLGMAPQSKRLLTLVDIVRTAFIETRESWSADRLIADPDRNCLFIHRCWQLGAQASQLELNWTLLHGRKNGVLSGIDRSKRFSIPWDQMDEFAFAGEIAARLIQRHYWNKAQRSLSLDRILCDQKLACQFDEIAAALAPGYEPFHYRWAALALRKARRNLENVPDMQHGGFEDFGSNWHVTASSAPKSPGVYRFVCGDVPLFVGQTVNLRRQVEIHFDHGGANLFPEWIDDQVHREIRLQFFRMDELTPSICAAAKSRHVDVLRPRLNWLPSAAI